MRMPNLRRRWTASDLLDLPNDGNRYEVVDGELFVTPAPSLAHQRAVKLLARLLDDYLATQPIGEVVIAPADVAFSDERVLEPDLFVIPLVNGRRPNKFADAGRLLLATEVLSPSTRRRDRLSKRVVYREEGVPEYWIVDLYARAIERSTATDTSVEIVVQELEWTPEGASASFVLNVPDYFARVLDG